MGTYVIKVTEFISEVKIDVRGLQQPQRLFLEELLVQYNLKPTNLHGSEATRLDDGLKGSGFNASPS